METKKTRKVETKLLICIINEIYDSAFCCHKVDSFCTSKRNCNFRAKDELGALLKVLAWDALFQDEEEE